MLFLRYESFKQYLRMYPVTVAILLINIIMFIVMTATGSSVDSRTLLRFGAMVNDQPYIGQYWRYFSSMFLHIGFDHLLFNCFSIFVFAPPLERLLGKAKYAAFYLGSGFAGNVAGVLLRNDDPILSAGASGAIYGVYAAFVYLGLFKRNVLDPASRKVIITVTVFGVIYSIIMPHVDLFGHIGGFVGGLLLFHLLRPRFHHVEK